MQIRWFVERRDDDSTWVFLDGDVPLIRKHRSPLIYVGQDEQVFHFLEPRGDRTGLPVDASPIPRACAQVQRRIAHHHSWRTIDELLEFDAGDDDFVKVIETMLRLRAERAIYWFED